MSNEQKLREAIKRLLKAHRITVQAPPKTITEAENQLREIENAVKYAEEALATTDPEPTGMPELPDADVLFEDGKDQYGYTEYGHAFSFRRTKAYGEQCWKAGYKHGAWADKPAVNQQLTTEPFDEREAFTDDTKDAERYRCIRRGQHVSVINGIGDILRAENLDAAIDAAMDQGVKG